MGTYKGIVSLLSAASLALVACAGTLEQAPLGKVVVYRNGVAYFERYASIENGEFSLLVEQAKVDDLLKSLTVEDAETGERLPISFPAREVSNRLVKMTVRVETAHTKRVKLSYVSESPAWKPSYRLTIGEDGRIGLQGWAIVDNRTGEDWNDIRVGVATTSALSFRYDLWSVRDVHRQTLGQDERLATAPPTATGLAPSQPSAGEGSPSSSGGVTLDQEYTRNIPVPGRTFESALGAAGGSEGDITGISFSGSYSLENQYVIDGVNTSGGTVKARPRSEKELAEEKQRRNMYARYRRMAKEGAAKTERKNDQMARDIIASEGTYVIHGVASPSERNSEAIALAMANHMRNQLIARGVPPSRLVVQTRVGAVGQPTTLEVKPQDGSGETEESRDHVGKSLFMSKRPVSITDQGTSMISIVDLETSGEIVYLYDPLSPRGNKDHAFRAIRFENPTDQYLEGGPVTVYKTNFVGEGLTESIGPGAYTILPFALDKQIRVEREVSYDDAIVGFVSVLDDGAIVAKRRRATIRFTVHNDSREPARVYIRHDSNRGWKVESGPKHTERLGRMSVFPVTLKPGANRTLEIVESTPITATLDLTLDHDVDALDNYLRGQSDSPFKAAAEKVVAAHRSISKKLHEIDTVAGQMAMYRNRLDDLHIQLVTLEAVRSKGRLMRTLKRRMEDMSAKVQKAIVQVVELRDEILVERLAYRDLIVAAIEIAPASK